MSKFWGWSSRWGVTLLLTNIWIFTLSSNNYEESGYNLDLDLLTILYWSCNHLRAGSHKVPSPMSQVTWHQSMQSQLLRAWKLGLTTSHRVSSPKSQVWHGWLHDNTFWRWGLGLVLRVKSSKKLDPTLNPSSTNVLHKITKIRLSW